MSAETQTGTGTVTKVPRDILDRMESAAHEARGALSLLKRERAAGRGDGRTARKLASRFRMSASELSIRFDTVAAFVGAEEAGRLASSLGCRWRPSARRLGLLDGPVDKPSGSVITT